MAITSWKRPGTNAIATSKDVSWTSRSNMSLENDVNAYVDLDKGASVGSGDSSDSILLTNSNNLLL